MGRGYLGPRETLPSPLPNFKIFPRPCQKPLKLLILPSPHPLGGRGNRPCHLACMGLHTYAYACRFSTMQKASLRGDMTSWRAAWRRSQLCHERPGTTRSGQKPPGAIRNDSERSGAVSKSGSNGVTERVEQSAMGSADSIEFDAGRRRPP